MAISRFVLKMLPGIDRPGDRHHAAHAEGAYLHAGPRRQRRLRARAPAAVRHHGLGTGELGRGQAAPDGGPAQHRGRGHQGQRAGEAGRRTDARAAGSIFTATSRATTSTRARPTSWCATASSATWRSRPPKGWRRCSPPICARNSAATCFTRLAGLVALPVINAFKHRVDHRRYNGASLLGLRGIVVKSHGSADAFAFEFAIRRAVRGGAHRRAGAHHRAHGGTYTRAQHERPLIPGSSAPAAIFRKRC